MKQLLRHILICLILLKGIDAHASHVLGGEIQYKHLKNNQYKVILKIYRDCNGCKINGNGGGGSSENCSEIDFIYVKGYDNSGYKESKFALTRDDISDITPVCKNSVSTCKTGSTSIFGIELHQFSAVVDFDNAKIRGYCNYQLYVAFAERNNNISTGQASQNFCVDAFLNTCLATENSSPEFANHPDFILNVNKKQIQSYFAFDSDGDSLVYQLTPALTNIDREASYNTGFNANSPLTYYCPDINCKPDKSATPPIGLYFGRNTGEMVFMPVEVGERAVIAVKVLEYRKISGKYELLGFIKRDIQVYIKNSDGNNVPEILSKSYFEVCDGDDIVIKLQASDAKNSLTNAEDTVSFALNSGLPNAIFTIYKESKAPYYSAEFKWKAQLNSNQNNLFYITVSAFDNFCPIKATSYATIAIKVLPKDPLKIKVTDLGCANYEVRAQFPNSKSKYVSSVSPLNGNNILFNSNKPLDSISFLPLGDFKLVSLIVADNGCYTTQIDTIKVVNHHTTASIVGDTLVCAGVSTDFLLINPVNRKAKISWLLDSKWVLNSNSANFKFNQDTKLTAAVTFQKGKWYCSDSVQKQIHVTELPIITGPEWVIYCHNIGIVDLNKSGQKPAGGLWDVPGVGIGNGEFNTNHQYPHNDDTTQVIYEVTNSYGCKSNKLVNIVLKSIPEFEIISIASCQMSTPVRFEHLVRKPYNLLDFSYHWALENKSVNIKDENGYKVVYPKDLGIGKHKYYGIVTGKNGCSNYDTATIEFTPVVQINISNSVKICQGSGEVNINKLFGVTPEGGMWSFYDFQLFKNKTFLQTDSCGIFEVTYTYDNYGCYDTKKLNIEILCKPNIDITSLPQTVCNTALPLKLSAKPFGGKWIGAFISDSTFNPPSIGQVAEYPLTYQIQAGECSYDANGKIKVIPTPEINISTDKTEFCESETVSISGVIKYADSLKYNYYNGNGYRLLNPIALYNNESLFTSKLKPNSSLQNIQFAAIGKNGCNTSYQLPISVFAIPSILPLHDTSLCADNDFIYQPKVKLNSTDVIKYKWYEMGNEFAQGPLLPVKSISPGNHTIQLVAGTAHCFDTASFKINILKMPAVNFIVKPAEVVSVTQANFMFINQSEPNLNLLWSFGDRSIDNTSKEFNPLHTYNDTGAYLVSLTGTNVYGCVSKVEKTLFVKPDILMYIPNAFTPDNKGDERNNVYSVTVGNCQSFHIEIFDRWGHKVYMSNNSNEVWDGKCGETECTPDVYFYTIKAVSNTYHEYKYRGTITLIK